MDKELKHLKPMLAGICSLIIAIGVARFSFTALLPDMLEGFLDVKFAGTLASLNYSGYLVGALSGLFTRSFRTKIIVFRAGIALCIITTFVLGVTQNHLIWQLSRIIAGVGSAIAMVVGSAIVFEKIPKEMKKRSMGVYFSGVGFAIFITALFSDILIKLNFTWQQGWLFFCFLSLPLATFALAVLRVRNDTVSSVDEFAPPSSLAAKILVFTYFLEGIGFVVQATFLPDIINSKVAGMGRYVWIVAGLAGIPSAIIWMRLAQRFSSLSIIVTALVLQAIGILLPVVSQDIYLNFLSGALYGSTMIGLVALFMNYGAQIYPKHPSAIMAILTCAYGIGQIVAPLYCVWFFERYRSYDYALVVTALLVVGAALLLLASRDKFKEKRCR